MMGPLPLHLLLLAALVSLSSCAATHREGLPPGSPFAETAAASTNLLPQGIAVGDVTSQSALLWLRTDGPMMVQVEWAPVAAWDTRVEDGDSRRSRGADAVVHDRLRNRILPWQFPLMD